MKQQPEAHGPHRSPEKPFQIYKHIISFWKKDGSLHLNKLESPSPKDALCQVWLKLAQWFWRRFLNFFNAFLLFHNYLPLEEGVALHLNKVESPLPKASLCQVGLKLVQQFCRRRKCEKFTTTTTTTTDNRQNVIGKASSPEQNADNTQDEDKQLFLTFDLVI